MICQKARMEKAIEMVRTNFNSVRTGRANPAILDKIEVWLLGIFPVLILSYAFESYFCGCKTELGFTF